MNSSSKHGYIRFYGLITIILQLIPPKFRFITLSRYCVFIFKTFLNSDWPYILPQGKTVCLKTTCKILALSNSRIERYVQYCKIGQLKISR